MNSKGEKTVLKQIMTQSQVRFKPLSPVFIQDFLAQCIASHNITCCFKLLQIMCLNHRISHDFLKKAVFIMSSTQLTLSTKDNIDESIKRCILDLLTLESDQTETLLEYLIMLMTQQKWEDAFTLSLRIKIRMKSHLRSVFPLLDNITDGYLALLDFVNWINSVNKSNISFDYICFEDNLKTKANKASFNLRKVIEVSSGPFDQFLLKFIEINLFYQNLTEIRDVLKNYILLNPNHLNGYIYMYNFLTHYYHPSDEGEENDIEQTLSNCFNQIVQLSPSESAILNMVEKNFTSQLESAQILFNFVDFIENKNNTLAWKQLHLILDKMDQGEKSKIIQIYKENYKPYWREYHFNFDSQEQQDQTQMQLFCYKQLVAAILEQFTDLSEMVKKFMESGENFNSTL